MQIKKYPHKNLNKNRMLYFQIGLSLVLFISFISIEWKSYAKPYKSEVLEPEDDFTEQAVVVVLPENKPKPIEKKNKEKKKKTEPVKLNDKPDNIFKSEQPEPNIDHNKLLGSLENPMPEPIPEVISAVVEDLPVFPGCEIYEQREERKDCMSKKIFKIISTNFDTDLARDLNLNGDQKIDVRFKVLHTGEVQFIDARAPHPKLKEEVKRLILKIPNLTPGKMGGKPVNVLFGIPIKYKVN